MRQFVLCVLSLTILAQDVVLDRTLVEAGASSSVLAQVASPGRYSFSVHSSQGARLGLVDRMAGEIQSAGVVGVEDGRIDVMLDRGTYQLRIETHPQATGDVLVEAHEFEESSWTVLRPYEVLQTQLSDLQAIRYWVDIPRQEAFHLEVMGRHLADAHVVVNGGWLVDLPITQTTFEAQPGKPMKHIEFHGTLSPGRYQFVVYGGTSAEWSVNDAGRPLYLRWGVPPLQPNGRCSFVVSPFGRDAFLLDSAAEYLELSRAEKSPTQLYRSEYRANQSRFSYSRSSGIQKDSRLASCYDVYDFSTDQQWVVVEAEPGAQLELVYLDRSTSRQLDRDEGPYFVAVHQSKAGDDALDLTAVISHPNSSEAVRVQAPQVGLMQVLARNINLNGPSTLLIQVTSAGKYGLKLPDDQRGRVEFAVEPALLEGGGERPPSVFRMADDGVSLHQGLFMLTLRPRIKGAISFVFGEEGYMALLDDNQIPYDEGKLTTLQWPDVSLPDSQSWYHLWVPNRSEVQVGFDVRALPLDLHQPLSLWIDRQSTLTLPAKLDHPSWLQLHGPQTPILFHGLAVEPRKKVGSGLSELVLRNESAEPVVVVLTAEEPPNWSDDAVPPEFGKDLVRLTQEQPVYRDFERNQSQYFILQVDQPALYRLETSGRLATALSVRTRIQTNLFSQAENGVGRNALVQQYLRAGEYLVTVTTRGRSMGRLGVHLKRELLTPGQPLEPATPQRLELARDAGSSIPFTIQEPDNYTFYGLGLGKSFGFRIEDEQQWPLIAHKRAASFSLPLDPGSYRLISLPEPVESRRIIGFDAEPKPFELTGKGPHPIALNQSIQHLWRKGDADVFTLQVHADLAVEVDLDRGMRMTLRGPDDEFNAAGRGPFDFRLQEGTWRIELTRLEDDDHYGYQFEIRSALLAIGVPQRVSSFPSGLDLRVGSRPRVRLWSLGTTDITARIFDESGLLVAEQDDAVGDWNIDFDLNLKPGSYRVELDAIGRQRGSVSLHLDPIDMATLPSQEVPFQFQSTVDQPSTSIPIAVSNSGLVRIRGCPGHSEISGTNLMGNSNDDLYWLAEPGDYNYTCHCQPAPDPIVFSAEWVEATPKEITGSVKLAAGSYRLHAGQPLTLRSAQDVGVATVEQPHFRMRRIFNVDSRGTWLTTTRDLELEAIELGQDTYESLTLAGLPSLIARVADRPHSVFIFKSYETELAVGPLGEAVNWDHMAIGERGTLWVSREPSTGLSIWATEASKTIARLHVEALNFEDVRGNSESSVELGPGQVREVVFSDPTWRQFTMPAGTLIEAVGQSQSYLGYAESVARSWTAPVEVVSARIWNLGPDRCRIRIDSVPPQPPVVADLTLAPFEGKWRNDQPHQLVLRGSPSAQLRAVGLRDARVYCTDGLVRSLADLGPGDHAGGALQWEGAPDVFLVWEDEGEAYAGLFPASLTAAPLTEFGRQAATGGLNAWRFSVVEPRLTRVSSGLPGLLAVWRDGKMVVSDWGNLSSCVFLAEAGEYLVTQRVNSGTLGGWLNIEVPEPVELSDGVSESAWIKTDEMQTYRLQLTQATRIGLGLIADSGDVSLVLFDSESGLIQSGPLQVKELEPGNYQVGVLNRGQPMPYRIAVYGRAVSTQIPDDVLAEFEEGSQP